MTGGENVLIEAWCRTTEGKRRSFETSRGESLTEGINLGIWWIVDFKLSITWLTRGRKESLA